VQNKANKIVAWPIMTIIQNFGMLLNLNIFISLGRNWFDHGSRSHLNIFWLLPGKFTCSR